MLLKEKHCGGKERRRSSSRAIWEVKSAGFDDYQALGDEGGRLKRDPQIPDLGRWMDGGVIDYKKEIKQV